MIVVVFQRLHHVHADKVVGPVGSDVLWFASICVIKGSLRHWQVVHHLTQSPTCTWMLGHRYVCNIASSVCELRKCRPNVDWW